METRQLFNVSTHPFDECKSELYRNMRYDHFLFENTQRPIRNKTEISEIKKDLYEVGYCVVNCVSNPYDIYKTFLKDVCSKKNIDNKAIDDVRNIKEKNFLETFRGIVLH